MITIFTCVRFGSDVTIGILIILMAMGSLWLRWSWFLHDVTEYVFVAKENK